MNKTGGDVAAFLEKVTPARRRRDAQTLVAALREVTGREPELWGTVVGFGSCHYRYPTGNEGDSPVVSFAPRKSASTLYLLDGIAAHADALSRLGPHKTGAGCLYLADVDAVDPDVLRGIVADSFKRVADDGIEGAEFTVTD